MKGYDDDDGDGDAKTGQSVTAIEWGAVRIMVNACITMIQMG